MRGQPPTTGENHSCQLLLVQCTFRHMVDVAPSCPLWVLDWHQISKFENFQSHHCPPAPTPEPPLHSDSSNCASESPVDTKSSHKVVANWPTWSLVNPSTQVAFTEHMAMQVHEGRDRGTRGRPHQLLNCRRCLASHHASGARRPSPSSAPFVFPHN